jgi:GAF domain-containing protein
MTESPSFRQGWDNGEVGAPLRDTRVIAGALVVGRTNHPRAFTDEERELVASFADQATIAGALTLSAAIAATQQRILELDRDQNNTTARISESD